MALKDFVFTSESVSEGHPDKVADQVSDAILDACLAVDPMSRVACETFTTTGLVMIGGEITTEAYVDMPQVVRQTLRRIGYTDPHIGFDAESCAVLTSIDRQSPDIAQGVNEGQGLHAEQGAGDQGLMFGFACDETPELMPLPIMAAHRLVQELAEVRRRGEVDFLRPDSKSQVTVNYVDGRPTRIDTIVVSTQHGESATHKQITEAIRELVIDKVIPRELVDDKTVYHVNPTGRFVVGGPVGDAGLTGRKIIVDTYGGYARHGGGAFSGKDATKVDRSAAYYTRYVAKNIVAAGLATKCEVQVAYAIGVARPVSVLVDCFDTETVDRAKLERAVREVFDFRPAAMISQLDLRRPIFTPTAAYGHFGRSGEGFTWERTDRADALRAAL
ncbi:MAG: methionine adenosyltransferase [Deltaproteobacteria bacterium HGW-Deltaproteobacteria-14]|jgi:S-adenosylmethionine synthetase|nr:MAG: methionine adenosyltransferase [Deltaproteobacteria bacterium HGW-Deltaproteobacteria-14]